MRQVSPSEGTTQKAETAINDLAAAEVLHVDGVDNIVQ